MQMPLVSVIVTTYNSACTLTRCLQSVLEQSYDNIELIVVDCDSHDKTQDIARKFTDKVFDYGSERSEKRNFGVKKSAGSLLLLIDSDMELSKDVVAACVARYLEGGCKAIVIPEESFGVGFWAECKRLERSFYVGVPWMEAARFFEKDAFNEMGGYDEKNTGSEDYDLPQRIVYKYGNHVIASIPNLISHNEQKTELLKTCRKKYYYAKSLGLYAKNKANVHNLKLQSSILCRYALFFSKPVTLFRNPVLGIGMIVMKTCEFAFGGIAYLTTKFSWARKL